MLKNDTRGVPGVVKRDATGFLYKHLYVMTWWQELVGASCVHQPIVFFCVQFGAEQVIFGHKQLPAVAKREANEQ